MRRASVRKMRWLCNQRWMRCGFPRTNGDTASKVRALRRKSTLLLMQLQTDVNEAAGLRRCIQTVDNSEIRKLRLGQDSNDTRRTRSGLPVLCQTHKLSSIHQQTRARPQVLARGGRPLLLTSCLALKRKSSRSPLFARPRCLSHHRTPARNVRHARKRAKIARFQKTSGKMRKSIDF